MLILLLSIFASSVLSKTAILDVSSTLSLTQHLFASNKQQHHLFPIPNSTLTFHLHSRVSVQQPSPSPGDYKALTLARLARDSARVKGIHARLTPFQEQKLQSSVISGSSEGSGEYFCRVGIGHPPTQAYMVLDTGSDVNWLQCAPCAVCYPQNDPIFDPGLSSSFTTLTCQAQQCKSLDISQCRNNTCLYQVSYGDGSYTLGDFAMETISFADSSKVENVAIGCGHNNGGLFIGASGLLGLGGGDLSFPSQIKANSFSYCLVDRDSVSSSTLEFNSAIPPEAITAPYIRNSILDTFFYVDLTGISVSGVLLSIPPSTFKLNENGIGGVILDSGTAISRLQTEAYNSVRDAFKKGSTHLRSTTGFALFDTCYDLSSIKSVEVPAVSFHFSNGNELGLPAKNYLIPVDSSGTFCFAFAATSSSLGIIGNVQQQGTRVTYDLVNSLIAFSPNKC